MPRLFSPFSQSGRFALLLVVNLVLSGGASAQDRPPREHERRGPTLVMPADGAMVGAQFIVRIGFAGGGPSEGTGINDAPPPPDGAPPLPGPGFAPRGPGEGTGFGPADHRHGPHFVLLIDQPIPQNGSSFHADAQHLSFPAGLPQMTVTLPAGTHKLLLQALDHDGNIIQRHPPEPITVTVK